LLFEEELAKEDSQVDVARAALFIAMHRTPELDVAACIAQLDDMGRALEARLPPPDERYTRRMLLAINAFMFEELGFRGADKTAFYVTENSCLDVVLATRRGIPLTLSLVYIELARRVRLPMVGVNIPAHYLIRPAVEDIEVRLWSHCCSVSTHSHARAGARGPIQRGRTHLRGGRRGAAGTNVRHRRES
jgi:regulator of sirC expression with transglutaminase-like and TPR domain